MAARSTSAAPTYFDPLIIDKDHFNYDGGIFANNPAIWGLIVASQQAKLEDITLISVGTGKADVNRVDEDMDKEINNNIQDNFWLKTLKKTITSAAYWKGVNVTDDDGKVKRGVADWINAEVILSLFDGM